MASELWPRDNHGRFVPFGCPNPDCGYGVLRFEGSGLWRCDGLADPNDENKELECCPFCHFDGEPYLRSRSDTTGAP